MRQQLRAKHTGLNGDKHCFNNLLTIVKGNCQIGNGEDESGEENFRPNSDATFKLILRHF